MLMRHESNDDNKKLFLSSNKLQFGHPHVKIKINKSDHDKIIYFIYYISIQELRCTLYTKSRTHPHNYTTNLPQFTIT